MKNLALLIVVSFVLAVSAPIIRADDAAPTTAPANVPPMQFDSKFDLKGMVNEMTADADRDPLGFLAKQMGQVTELLAKLNTHDPTQPTQEQILARLDELIDMIEKQKQQQMMQAVGGPNPSQPLPDSMIASGPRGGGPMRDPN